MQALYDQIKHKKKVLVNKKVINVVHNKDSVSVECADGSIYTGDIVIGADGIHSKIRKEMGRIAHDSNPGMMERDETSTLFPPSYYLSPYNQLE